MDIDLKIGLTIIKNDNEDEEYMKALLIKARERNNKLKLQRAYEDKERI